MKVPRRAIEGSLVAILLLSFLLGIWGNRWGAPNIWHPDEVTMSSIDMVRAKTLNAHHFTYGGLPRYLVAIGAVIPIRAYARFFDPKVGAAGSPERAGWEDRQNARIVVTARTITAVLGTMLVCLTFAVASMLFDSLTGLLAALLLTVAAHSVVLAHFATVDIGATFWYWLACCCALLYWRQGRSVWLYAACFAGGLAFGVKADRALVVIPLLAAFLLRAQRRVAPAVVGLLLFLPAGYLVANPPLVTSTFEYLDGYTREIFYNSLRSEGHSSYLAILSYARTGLGTPLFLLALVGSVYAVYAMYRAGKGKALVWLLATFLPYYAIVGHKYVVDWYVPFFYPPLMILAAYGCTSLTARLPRQAAVGVVAAIVLVIALSLSYTLRAIQLFAHEPRDLASIWISQHVAPGSIIVVVGEAPVLPSGLYKVDVRPNIGVNCDFHLPPLERLDLDPTYLRLRGGILSLERWAGRTLGTPVRPEPYVAWFDRFWQKCEEPYHPAADAGAVSSAQYLVIIGNARSKTLGPDGLPGKDYRFVARFETPAAYRAKPLIEFVSQPVVIFERASENSREAQ